MVYQNEKNLWCRKCPKCKKELEYPYKCHANYSEEKNAKCIVCKNMKEFDGIYQNSE